ncbi:MAG: S8 family serine peptidase [Nitrospirae bacterium]|nr:S8 family serine peptidase [Nitrospirota bacterium]
MRRRGLSPFSTTSLSWIWRKWPIKPEVVFEGGNVASGPNDSIVDIDDLQLLSTNHEPHIAQFASFNGTSAASAQAAWMAAQIQIQYPGAWPETIRALIIHSAKWTDTMKSQFSESQSPNKKDCARLLRICGYGVPNLNRASYCSSNSLTLI